MEMADMEDFKGDESDRPIERSPRGRYIRFETKLGSGAYKTVFKAYDTDQGIDVAWNAIGIGLLPNAEKTRIIQEVQLLQKLEHKNIINFYGSWFCKEKNQVVFITEIMTSGTLKSYIKRVQFVKWKIIKRWCLQILEGLRYLHGQSPAVIHRDLKCDNIFINGNTGDLRIGDLGLSTQLAVHQQSRAQSVLGTPEFMAPELYDESYDEKVDIYAFGMCVLEMVTKEVPYIECLNPAQIYKKVTAGIRPRGLQRVASQAAREFIELCLSRGNGEFDVSAEYLMHHTFLKPQDDDNDYVQLLNDEEVKTIDTMDVTASLAIVKEIDFAHGDEGVQMVCDVVEDKFIAARRASSVHGLVDMSAGIIVQEQGLEIREPSASVTVSKPAEEPFSTAKNDHHHVNDFLESMPGTENGMKNTRINVMMGRGDRLTLANEEDETKLEVIAPSASQNRTVEPTPAAAQPADFNSDIAAPEIANSISQKRGRRHDIKASKDPDTPHSILLNLRIMIDGKSKEIQFPFNLYTDSSHEVACELALDVGIMEPDLEDISDSISFLVTEGKSNNLPHVDVDVWEEAPEPHSFSSKPLPHVSKMAFHTANSVSSSTKITIPAQNPPAYAIAEGYDAQRGNGNMRQRKQSLRENIPPMTPDNSISTRSVGIHEYKDSRSTSPPRRNRQMLNMPLTEQQRVEDWINHGSDDRDTEISITNANEAAKYAYDDPHSNIEVEIRSEEEKHQREIQRFRKKIQELEQKQRAAKARQERLASGDEYSSESDLSDVNMYARRAQPMQPSYQQHHSYRMFGQSPPKPGTDRVLMNNGHIARLRPDDQEGTNMR